MRPALGRKLHECAEIKNEYKKLTLALRKSKTKKQN